MRRILIRECIRRAREKHNLNHPSWDKKSVHYSFIIKNNKILEMGVNRPDQHPPDYYGYPFYADLHSELDAWHKAKGLLRGTEFEMVNIRLLRYSNLPLANSSPCNSCISFLTAQGCKKFYFSTDSGHVAKLIP